MQPILKFEWDEQYGKAFNEINHPLFIQHDLRPFDSENETVVCTDVM